MSVKAIWNSIFEKICCIKSDKKAYANVLAVFIVLAVSFLATFAITRIIPSNENVTFTITVKEDAGGTVLKEEDVEDISVFYATEEAPVFSDRLKITKKNILSSNPTVLNLKYITGLPNDIIGIRVDLDLADTVVLKDGVFPEVRLRINETRFYGSPEREKPVIVRKTEHNHYLFEIQDKDVMANRTPYSWRVLASLFFIITTLLWALYSICSGIVSCQNRSRTKKSPPDTIQAVILKCSAIVPFLLLSIFPLFKLNLEKIDKWENRTLEPFPEHFHFNDASACFSQAERFFNDRFFGRNYLIGLSDALKTTFDKRDSSWVYKGDDNWLFYYESLPETKYSTFKQEFFSEAEKYIRKIADYAESEGKRFVYVICPDKYRIYGDRLTSYSSNYFFRKDIVDDFVEYMKRRNDFPIIYQRQELLKKKADSGHDIYYRYDTHWTEEGAYYGLYLPVLKALSVAPIPIDRWEQKEGRDGDLIAFLFGKKSKKQTFPPHTIYEPVFDQTADVHTVEDPHIQNSEYDIIISSNPDGVPLNILFLRDSFMTAAISLFANTFQQSVFIRRYRFFESDMEYIDRSDIIVLEHVERYVYQMILQEFDLEE